MEGTEPILAEHMILLGATARNLGKTALAVQLIEKYKEESVVGIKVIVVENHGDVCPRGGKGCGICSGLKSSYDIVEEKGEGTKDTMLFKKAGAKVVYLVRSYPEHLREAMEEVLKLVGENERIICESNRVRKIVKPQSFYMIADEKNEIKPSAAEVIHLADKILKPYETICE